ncbi:hypothetical protein SSBR45G_70150 [Bradyrhizobium sp. SSBR45G]|uniref:hypothetical protein n=1 Tax=unclassified Bradyrhizobium TaxID=2631580 RepID=UPI002342B592|nr:MULTISPECIES: hypothetical protein [unclassified Bradyrhizobium]GLH82106.1 hypothetical protein SSBR45G_70150 [Bradyrhizobium sp. SSBR45G]GLH89538.1 hypothetical protein SSBR45R_69990 [Bradyrhizobium sp. SSBR45R]
MSSSYAAEHGHTFEVGLFEVPAKTSDATILILRDAFCKLVLECWSSFRFNNADEIGDPSDSYPDTLHFRAGRSGYAISLHLDGCANRGFALMFAPAR